MNYFPKKLFDQIKQWNAIREELDDKIDFIYELIDWDKTDNKEELLNEIKGLNTQRDELDDLVDVAYEQIDRYIYNQAI